MFSAVFMELYRRQFNIHNVIVEFAADDSDVMDTVTDFLALHKSDSDMAPHISIKLQKHSPVEKKVPENAHWFFNYWGVAGFVYEEIYYYISLGSLFVFYPSTSIVECTLTDELTSQRRFFTHGVLTIILMETLRYHGLYFLHGAALEGPDGTSLLITGESGAGKTTVAVALIHNGWKWLTDDTLFLRNGPDRLELLPFRRPFHIPPALAEKIDELSFLKDAPAYFPNNPKRALAAQEIYGALGVPSINRPNVVLFSSIEDAPESRVEKMSTLNGLNEIIRNSPYVLFSRPPAKAHLDALKLAVQGAKCYRLRAGRDLLEDPAGAVLKILGTI